MGVCNDTTAQLYVFKMILDLVCSIWPAWVFRQGCVGSWETPAGLDVASGICSYKTILKHKAVSALFS